MAYRNLINMHALAVRDGLRAQLAYLKRFTPMTPKLAAQILEVEGLIEVQEGLLANWRSLAKAENDKENQQSVQTDTNEIQELIIKTPQPTPKGTPAP